jgi:hypothetical protein
MCLHVISLWLARTLSILPDEESHLEREVHVSHLYQFSECDSHQLEVYNLVPHLAALLLPLVSRNWKVGSLNQSG